MAKILTYEEMAEKIAEEALDGYIYEGKTLREWIKELQRLKEEESILDKIRAEIFNVCSDNHYMPVHKLSCDEIFEIIDKYGAESEDKK